MAIRKVELPLFDGVDPIGSIMEVQNMFDQV